MSEDAIAVINQPKYRLNSQLTEVMNKSDYLLKKPFPSKHSPFWDTRFAHHLKKNLGTMAVMTKEAAYMTFGLGAFAVGLNKCLPDNGKDSNLPIGLTYMAMGASLVAAPIISAVQSAKINVP